MRVFRDFKQFHNITNLPDRGKCIASGDRELTEGSIAMFKRDLPSSGYASVFTDRDCDMTI